jgi:magnesium-transporting ATPase (P-type)
MNPSSAQATEPQPQRWHALSAADCLAGTDSRASGLSSAEAELRISQHGANIIAADESPRVLRRFLRQFHNVLLYVLMAAAALTAAFGQWLDASVISAVVLVNAIVGFVQEGRAEQAIRAIRSMLSTNVYVLRDGQRSEIPASALVPGDIITLQAGDRVPADARVFDSRRLEIDQSVLTGESIPALKSNALLADDTALPDRSNMAYAGTLVTRGYSTAVVTGTGEATQLGRISGALRSMERVSTPLLERISRFARRMSMLILLLSGAIAAFGFLFHGYAVADMVVAAVTIAVAAIPEGLPPVITITLAIGVRKMAKRNAIVRRLPAVETLGEVDVICTDKTGTLTANEMTVRTLHTGDGAFQVSGVGYQADGDISAADGAPPIPASVLELARAGLCCNDARVDHDQDSAVVVGDPMEAALIVLAGKAGLDPTREVQALPRVDLVPFESESRFMATLHRQDQSAVVYAKGAPETLLGMCHTELIGAEQAALRHGYWHEVAAGLARQGFRVLALARRTVEHANQTLDEILTQDELCLLGVVGVVDPPRPEVPDALRQCEAAGIQVKMITGDHAETAAAIGRELQIAANVETVTGDALDQLDSAALDRTAANAHVFARTSPAHKLRLVKSLQEQGRIVAMTGDGVNDAPALKIADVGVAMGHKGTQAARDAADVVLADDNFATIVGAVETGRIIYDNIRKSVAFLLPTSVAEALVIGLALIFGMQLPMTPVQILWINMITAVTLGVALAFEPGSSAVMQRSPQASRASLMSPLVLWRTVFVALLMVAGIAAVFVLVSAGYPLEYARTACVNALVFFEVVYLLSVRHLMQPSFTPAELLENPVIFIALGLVAVFQLAFTYTAPFQFLFESSALDVHTWVLILAAGAALFAIVELEKWVLRRRLH